METGEMASVTSLAPFRCLAGVLEAVLGLMLGRVDQDSGEVSGACGASLSLPPSPSQG